MRSHTKTRLIKAIRRTTPVALAVASFCGNRAALAQEDDAVVLQEIIVTASGRTQSVQDVPYNISVVTDAALTEAAVTDTASLARQVPGLIYTDLGARSNGINNGIILRGLNGTSAGIGNASPAAGEQTVSTYINGTPLFSNLKLSDVERVEVLRGPQGTLYGAGSVGGTVRYLFNRPDLEMFSGDVQAKLSQSQDSDDFNYALDSVVNLPLSDKFALRVSAGYEYLAGVIDARKIALYDSNGSPLLADPTDYFGSTGVFTTEKDVDDSSVRYVRPSLLWKVSDDVEALLMVQHQDSRASDFTGIAYNNNADRELVTDRNRKSPAKIVDDLFSLEVTADLGFATLTSTTSYTDSDMDSQTDYTNFGLALQSFYADFPRIMAYNDILYDTTRRTQEFRLVSDDDGAWDWVAGAYYSKYRQKSSIPGYIPGWAEFTNTPGHPTAVAALGPGATWAEYYQTFYPDARFDDDLTFILDKDNRNENKALYGELSYHFTDKWQVTGGGRVFWVSNDRRSIQGLPYTGSAGDFDARQSSSDQDQIFKLNTSYDLSKHNMVYFTWSQGYRQGGANALPMVGPFAADPALVPYEPDFATNWEAGAKGVIMNTITYSAAVFYVDWKDLQIQFPAPGSGIPTLANGETAVSKGVEVQLSAPLTDFLEGTLGYAYTDAQLTESFTVRTGFNGVDGDRLPGVPKTNLTAALTARQPLAAFGGSTVVYRADAVYRSDVTTALNESARNYAQLGGFTTANASVNLNVNNVRIGAYVNNLTNNLGITGVDVSNDTTVRSRPGSLYFIQRPRTVGVSVGYSF